MACILIAGSVPFVAGAEVEPSRKIVVFKEGVSLGERDSALGDLSHNRIKRLERALTADVVVGASNHELARLSAHPAVLRIDEDVVVYALERAPRPLISGERFGSARRGGGGTQVALPQQLPWGIDRIDAELVWPGGNSANPIKVGIIDTGISLSHPDLSSNIKGNINTINSKKKGNDDNGHGSHVAGIVAALNNTQGVVGGAPLADLYAIKVLGANGSGYLSDIIEGLDWAIARDLDVVNMSLGTTADVQSFHDAVARAYYAGITIICAAGNNGGAVIYPAAYPEVIAVSATDSSDTLASWSSRGPEVDLAAPGVSIYSTYKGTGYETLSGTSMASPHVTAAAALLLNRPVRVSEDTDGDGAWDPSEVAAHLQSTATDLGALGTDIFYGAGLVNAFAALE